MKTALATAIGFVIGIFFSLMCMVLNDVSPSEYNTAAKPAFAARNINFNTASADDLATALNPCIVKGELPEECKKYVVNGVVTQPPIKIVIDTSK